MLDKSRASWTSIEPLICVPPPVISLALRGALITFSSSTIAMNPAVRPSASLTSSEAFRVISAQISAPFRFIERLTAGSLFIGSKN